MSREMTAGMAMGSAFSRTTRALRADRGLGGRLAVWAALLCLLLWALWLGLGRVTVYEVSKTAHVEVTSASRDVSPIQKGRLVASGLFIGRRVRAGEVLAELDSEPQKLRLAEAEARLAAFPARIGGLRRQLAASEDAQAGAGRARSAAIAAARARTREAQASSDFDRNLAQRQRADAESGGTAPVEAERSEAEARRAAAAREASRHEEGRVAGEAEARSADLAGDSARIGSAITGAESDLAAAQALVEQLRYELDARKIRAPVDGVIGTVASARLGEVVEGGASLATIVPDGDLHIVAAFDPSRGLGRLSQGQTARLRLDGFSWTQYGDFPARVDRVATESSGNLLRVELSMKRRGDEDLPLRHGMTGQVDVAIEQVSPAIMVLRAIGQLLA